MTYNITQENLNQFDFSILKNLDVLKLSNTLTTDQIIFVFQNVFVIETSDISLNIKIQIKNLPTEQLIKFYQHFMQYDNIKNTRNVSLLLNLLNILKNYNTFSDSFFNNDDVYINNIEQFLDLKTALHDEIQSLANVIATFYLSIIKSMTKNEYTMLDEYVDMPQFMHAFYSVVDLCTLSGILTQCSNTFQVNTIFIKNAKIYENRLTRNYKIAESLIYNLIENNEKA